MCAKKVTKKIVVGSARIDPVKLTSFVETRHFSNAWKECGLSVDPDLLELQDLLRNAPKSGSVLKSTGGVRKIRFSPSRSKTGKSGAFRVCYVYFESHAVILKLLVYPKSEKENISDADRQSLKKLIDLAEQILKTKGWKYI